MPVLHLLCWLIGGCYNSSVCLPCTYSAAVTSLWFKHFPAVKWVSIFLNDVWGSKMDGCWCGQPLCVFCRVNFVCTFAVNAAKVCWFECCWQAWHASTPITWQAHSVSSPVVDSPSSSLPECQSLLFTPRGLSYSGFARLAEAFVAAADHMRYTSTCSSEHCTGHRNQDLPHTTLGIIKKFRRAATKKLQMQTLLAWGVEGAHVGYVLLAQTIPEAGLYSAGIGI